MKQLLTLFLLTTALHGTAQDEMRYSARPLASGSMPPVEVTDNVQQLFLRQQWSQGTVVLKNSGASRQLPLLFDVYNNQLFYQQAGQVMEFLEPVQQFTLSLLRKNDSTSLLFRSGYPAVQRNDETTFYEVLVDGRYQLLRCKAKTVYLAKDRTPDETRSYSRELLYVYLPEGKLVPVKKDKAYLLAQLPEQAATIQQLTDRHKLKLKNEDGMVRLFTLLNGQ